MSRPTNVLVTHEHRLVRECLIDAISGTPDLRVVAHSGDGRDAVLNAQRTKPNVVLLRPWLPRLSGVEACGAIIEAVHGARAIMLADDDDPQLLLSAVQAGAAGYVALTEDLSDVLGALRRVVRGETVVPPLLLGQLLKRLIERQRGGSEYERFFALTPREREVLTLLVRGHDQVRVGKALSISPQTARTHIQNLISKLGVHSRVEAAALAVEHGWVEVPARHEHHLA